MIMYIYIYLYMEIHIFICKYIHIYTYIYIYIYIHTYIYLCVYIYIFLHVGVDVFVDENYQVQGFIGPQSHIPNTALQSVTKVTPTLTHTLYPNPYPLLQPYRVSQGHVHKHLFIKNTPFLSGDNKGQTKDDETAKLIFFLSFTLTATLPPFYPTLAPTLYPNPSFLPYPQP
jgi:hypothetical protein